MNIYFFISGATNPTSAFGSQQQSNGGFNFGANSAGTNTFAFGSNGASKEVPKPTFNFTGKWIFKYYKRVLHLSIVSQVYSFKLRIVQTMTIEMKKKITFCTTLNLNST